MSKSIEEAEMKFQELVSTNERDLAVKKMAEWHAARIDKKHAEIVRAWAKFDDEVKLRLEQIADLKTENEQLMENFSSLRTLNSDNYSNLVKARKRIKEFEAEIDKWVKDCAKVCIAESELKAENERLRKEIVRLNGGGTILPECAFVSIKECDRNVERIKELETTLKTYKKDDEDWYDKCKRGDVKILRLKRRLRKAVEVVDAAKEHYASQDEASLLVLEKALMTFEALHTTITGKEISHDDTK